MGPPPHYPWQGISHDKVAMLVDKIECMVHYYHVVDQ